MKCTLNCVSWNSPKEILHSVFSLWRVVYMRFRTGQKSGTGWKKREENHFHFFIELLLEHVTVNETEAFEILPDKWDKG